MAHVTHETGWTVAVTGDHAGIPAVAIADELARSVAVEVHGAGGNPQPMRVAAGDTTHEARTLVELRARYGGGARRPATIVVPTREGDIVITSTEPSGFAIASDQRFLRMALALAFLEVPLDVSWSDA